MSRINFAVVSITLLHLLTQSTQNQAREPNSLKGNSLICKDDTNTTHCDLLSSINLNENFTFDFSRKSTPFTITGQSAYFESTGYIKIQSPPNYSVNIQLVNSLILSPNISIDLGDFRTVNSSLTLDGASSIKSDGLSQVTLGVVPGAPNLMVCFAGCNLTQDTFPSIQSVYGSEVVDYDFAVGGDQAEIQGQEFFGSSNPNATSNKVDLFTAGGGRVFVRARTVSFLDRISAISSNGYQGKVVDVDQSLIKASGTGGVVFIAAQSLVFRSPVPPPNPPPPSPSPNNTTKFEGKMAENGASRLGGRLASDPDSDREGFSNERGSPGGFGPSNYYQIKAEGSNLLTQSPTYYGGGGRIYIFCATQNPLESLLTKVSTTGYTSETTNTTANAGTVYLSNQTDEIVAVMSHAIQSKTVVQAQTLLRLNGSLENIDITALNSNVSHILNTQSTFGTLTLDLSATYWLYSTIKLRQPLHVKLNVNELYMSNFSNLRLEYSGVLDLTATFGVEVTSSSQIKLVPQTYLQLRGMTFIMNSGSIINSTLTIYDLLSRSRYMTMVEILTDEISVENSTIIADKIVVSPSQVALTLMNTELSNIKYSCPSSDDSLELDFFIQNCSVRPQGGVAPSASCVKVWNKSFEELSVTQPPSLSFILLDIPQVDWIADSVKFKNVGYLGIKALSLMLTETSSISASSSGCPAVNPVIGSSLSKYIKVCEVQGGSNVGRGTLGQSINMELCQFLVPKPNPVDLIDIPLSGAGGQKSHQIEDITKDGYGGGIINIFTNNSITIQGAMQSDGGSAQHKNFLSTAAGAGGTIKLSSAKIILDSRLPPTTSATTLKNSPSQPLKSQKILQNGTKNTTNSPTLISIRGGTPSQNLGAGGGGKLVLDCRDWFTDPDCIEISTTSPIDTSSGAFGKDLAGAFSTITMQMIKNKRPLLFDGGVVNKNPCLPGRQGALCQECPLNSYKSTVDNNPCVDCPCQKSSNLQTGMASIEDCQCDFYDHVPVSLGQVGATVAFFAVLMTFFYLIMKKKKSLDDKNYKSSLRYKVNDIPNSHGRIFVLGSNTPEQPWRIEVLNSSLEEYFDEDNFLKFRNDFEGIAQWASSFYLTLSLLKIFFYSPIYLFVLRLVKAAKIKDVQQFIDKQEDYSIFKKSSNDGKRKPKYVLKWTCTSDKSTLFLDIVEIMVDNKIKLGWEMKFPQTFIIFGNGSYNRPFKLESRDPLLIKMIDHLKTIVSDSEEYIDHFDIPNFLVNYIRVTNQKCHFLDFYFSILNTYLKSLSSLETKKSFTKKFFEICDYLEKANRLFLSINGYIFKIDLAFQKKATLKSFREPLNIPLQRCELRKKMAAFFFKLLNHGKEGTIFSLRLCIDKSGIGRMMSSTTAEVDSKINRLTMRSEYYRKKTTEVSSGHKKMKRLTSFSDDEEELMIRQADDEFKNIPELSLAKVNNQIISLKNEYRSKLMKKVREDNRKMVDFEQLESLFIEEKKFSGLIFNRVVRFGSVYIYKHHILKTKINYMSSFIFTLLLLQMVLVLFSIYSIGMLTYGNETSTMLSYFMIFEWVAPFPFSHMFCLFMGILCFVTNWKVKVGKMFVSANMICVINLLSSFIIWSILVVLFKIEDYVYVLIYFVLSLMARFLLSFCASLLVSKTQTFKTMGKILASRNIDIRI